MNYVAFPQIGELQFVQNAAAKHIRISLKPFGGVRVTFPAGVPVSQVISFVETKTHWILQAQARMQTYEKRRVFTPDTVFSTQHRQLQMYPWKSTDYRLQLTKDAVKIFYPHETDLLSAQNQEHIRKLIIRAIRQEAAEYLPQQTEQLATLHSLNYCGVTVKNISSRWGSCSASNRINLNIHLMCLPRHLSDYVILHELAHTIHKNHGPAFWKYLDTLTGNKARHLAAEMKQYHIDTIN